MSNLLSSLVTASGAMQAFDRALSVIQNNVSNSTTPGFAKQRQSLTALTFEPGLGYSGGVLAGKLISYRNEYSERGVRREQQALGRDSQRAASLADLEPLFSLSGEGGITGTLTRLFESFSVLSVSPNSISARQGVLDRARELASAFNQSAASLRGAADNTSQQIRSAVDKINALVGEIRTVNEQRRQNYAVVGAAGPDAQLNTALEGLSELVDFTALQQTDGTVTVLLGGQVPLVIGDRQYSLAADFSTSAAQVLDQQGNDVGGMISGGRLSSLLETRNALIPGLLAGLDQLAAAVADRVNATLAEGLNFNGSGPTKNLFVYSDQPAVTLAVTDILPEELAAASPGAPGGNANALRLAALANSKEIDGLTFTEAYGSLAGRLGRQLATARDDQQLHADLLAQSKQLRADGQGVSLDEEAVNLIEFQRAYQASAQFLRVLNELTDTVIHLI